VESDLNAVGQEEMTHLRENIIYMKKYSHFLISHQIAAFIITPEMSFS